MTERVAFRIKDEMLAEIRQKIKEGKYEDLSNFFRTASRNELAIDDDSRLDRLENSIDQLKLDNLGLQDEILLLNNQLRGLVSQLSEVVSPK